MLEKIGIARAASSDAAALDSGYGSIVSRAATR
jgi:hypothetical protein